MTSFMPGTSLAPGLINKTTSSISSLEDEAGSPVGVTRTRVGVGGRATEDPLEVRLVPPPNFAPDGPPGAAKTQVGMALTPNSLARRKPGVKSPHLHLQPRRSE